MPSVDFHVRTFLTIASVLGIWLAELTLSLLSLRLIMKYKRAKKSFTSVRLPCYIEKNKGSADIVRGIQVWVSVCSPGCADRFLELRRLVVRFQNDFKLEFLSDSSAYSPLPVSLGIT